MILQTFQSFLTAESNIYFTANHNVYSRELYGIIQNVGPSANNDSATTEFETSIDISILLNDSDFDGSLDTSSIFIVSSVSSGNLEILSSGEVKYTPNSGFSGENSFIYTVNDNDGATSNEATVTITVKVQPTPTPMPPPPPSRGGGSTSLLLILMMLTYEGRRYYR